MHIMEKVSLRHISLIIKLKFKKILTGFALNQLNRYDEALFCFNKTIDLDPLDKKAYYAKAFAYEKLDQYEEALKNMNKFLELEQNSSYGFAFKGEILNKLEKYNEAIKCFFR
jgi:tetratricopeptide (TPR) repeat protein